MITSASPQSWITGEEFAAERNRLREMGLVPHSPEYEALLRRVDERDDYLWSNYGEPMIKAHPGKWVAISLDGRVLIGDSDWDLCEKADDLFGPANYYSGRLDKERGAQRIGARRG